MLEKILGSNQSQTNTAALKMVALAAISISPSQFLWRAQLVVYLALLILSFVALWPFFLASIYALPAWLILVLLIFKAISQSYKVKNAAPMTLEIVQNLWRLKVNSEIYIVNLHKDLLLWSWLIIIPLRGVASRKQHYLVALPDSMSKEDWRRLSLWLKTCLHSSD